MAFAVKVTNLYEVALPVATQTSDERTEAIQRGFEQMLVKVSGDPAVGERPVIKSAINKADYYVEAFNYAASARPASEDEKLKWQDGLAASHYFIHIRFEKEDVNRLLKKAEVNYWGEHRPLLMVWLAIKEKDKEPQIIGNETANDLLTNFEQEGKKYGLPLIFPAMDISDMNLVSVDDVTKPSLDVLKEASRRYAPDMFLIGNVQANKDGYEGQWELVLGDTQWRWSIKDKTAALVVSRALGRASQTLTKRYAINNSVTQQA